MYESNNTWFQELSRNAKGEILNTMSNIASILLHDPNLKNIVFNEMQNGLDIAGSIPWSRGKGSWCNTDFPCLEMYLEEIYHIYSPRKCRDALQAILSSRKRYHPIKDYLEQLEWDGQKRLDELLINYLGAEDTDYVREVTRKTFTAAIARIYEPGIKFDTILVLCGEQGIGKSTLFARMAGKWYSDSMTIADMIDKSAAEKLQGIWIMELSELAGIRKIDVETVKSFLSRRDDQYRSPYGTYVESHPRNSIIVGTTNTTNGFLRDITGNRRFWPVTVTGKSNKNIWELSDAEIGQFWAEALHHYRQKETLYLKKDIEAEARKNQRLAMELDPRQGLIGEYLETSGKSQVCLMELWCDCLGKERSDMKKRDAFELEGILRQIGGWDVYQGNTTGKKRLPGYGVQKTFVKEEKFLGKEEPDED